MNYETDGQFHHAILESLAIRMSPAAYLELGLWDLPALLHVAKWCELSVGVDTVGYLGKDPLPPNSMIFQMTTDEFFANEAAKLPKFELIFVDADHKAESAAQDGRNALRFAADNAIIVFHDTFPEDPGKAVEGYCHDSYRVPSLLSGWELVTLPCPPGITIARVNPKSRV